MNDRQIERYLLNQSNNRLFEIRVEIDRIINSRNDEFFKMHLKTEHQRYVIKAAADYWGVPFEAAYSKRRFGEIQQFKHAFRFGLRCATSMSLQAIGKMLNCDHATVMHSIKYVQDSILADPTYYMRCIDFCEHIKMVMQELEMNKNSYTFTPINYN
jgi:chromosomal replication initiation ATPase DnaA